MKKILIILAVLFVLIIALLVGGVIIAAANIDGLVKAGIEKGGTYATGVETTVEGVDVALFSGTLTMNTLQIDNPNGFSTPHFMTLGDTDVEIKLASISQDKIIVPKVHLSGIEVYLDKGNNPSNYNAILNNLKRFESDETAPPTDTAKDDVASKPVVIESFVLEDISVHVANMPGVSMLTGDVAVTIPRIELKNIGEKEAMSIGDIVGLVVKTVLSAAIENGGGILPSDVLGDLAGGLGSLSSLSDLGIDAIGGLDGIGEDIGKQAQEAVDDLTEQGEKAIEDIKDQAEDAAEDIKKELEDGIGNIFGKKKKDDDG